MLGESPPPPPRVFFGRDELVEKIIGFAEDFIPIALIGAGGIGKTSIALTVLCNDRIKGVFGDNRRFIRCDQLSSSLPQFLAGLSKVIGAGIENPEDLASLRPFLSSKKIFLVIDNAESVLDPRGTDAQDIYAVVEELSRFSNIFLCITSRITTVPPDCETLYIPTLSIQAARDTFYRVCRNGGRPDLVDNMLEQLDFHPLSVTLLATVAHQNNWDTNRLSKEWERQGTGVLQTQHNKSLATTIEFSLASPMFQGLGPDARDLLGVVAFFPQGVDENNFDWLFPTISNKANIFDTFCILSLTNRGDGFITMLAPLRDYFRPKDPKSSPLLCATKERYFDRLSVDVYPDKPGHEAGRWISSEDVNVEHLLDVFTSVDGDSDDVWEACADFMRHIVWHKRRLVMLGPRIEGLPDDHRFKLECLYELSQLLNLAGNHTESKRLLNHALKLWRERGNDFRVAQALRILANVNRLLGLDGEAAQQAKEALAIFERLEDTVEQAHSLQLLAWSLYGDNQLAAAEEAASRVIGLLPDNSEQFLVCRCRRFLGYIHLSKGEVAMAIDQFQTALSIASAFNWHTQLFWNRYSLAEVAFCEGKFGDANGHIECAKLHAVNYSYLLGRAMHLQASTWFRQRRVEEARAEALGATDVLERLGASQALDECRALLQQIELVAASPGSDDNDKLFETVRVTVFSKC
jgi:tetratricopeptide (TPR) repeat protein